MTAWFTVIVLLVGLGGFLACRNAGPNPSPLVSDLKQLFLVCFACGLLALCFALSSKTVSLLH